MLPALIVELDDQAFDLKTGAECKFAWADGNDVDWKGGVATIREKRVNGDVALIKGAPWGV